MLSISAEEILSLVETRGKVILSGGDASIEIIKGKDYYVIIQGSTRSGYGHGLYKPKLAISFLTRHLAMGIYETLE